jgi:hypothetical protein
VSVVERAEEPGVAGCHGRGLIRPSTSFYCSSMMEMTHLVAARTAAGLPIVELGRDAVWAADSTADRGRRDRSRILPARNQLAGVVLSRLCPATGG